MKRASRANSLAGSINAGEDASLFIAKEPAPSEADSGDIRKKMSNQIRKDFDLNNPAS